MRQSQSQSSISFFSVQIILALFSAIPTISFTHTFISFISSLIFQFIPITLSISNVSGLVMTSFISSLYTSLTRFSATLICE